MKLNITLEDNDTLTFNALTAQDGSIVAVTVSYAEFGDELEIRTLALDGSEIDRTAVALSEYEL